MVHLRPVILALLLAVAAPVAAIPSSAPSLPSATTTTSDNQVYAPENTSAVLTLGKDADETRAFVRPSLDVGTTLAIQQNQMDSQLTSRSYKAEFSQLDSRATKRDLLFKQATEIEDRTRELENRARTARESFRNGTISPTEYVQTLVLIDSQAQLLQKEVTLVEDRTREVPKFTLTDYLGQFDKRLVSLRGPIRGEVVGSLRGNNPPQRIYVSASNDGITLSTIDDGVYEREVYRSDHRALDVVTYNVSQLQQRSKRFYPWTWKDGNYRGEGWAQNEDAGQLIFSLEHTHGELSGYFDMSNGLVFREFQRKYLTSNAAARNDLESTMPKGPGVTANESGLLLTVNRSYAGGPMYVALQENGTGDYVEGTITVDGEMVGTTSTDGGLWTLSPAGSFNVSASSGLDVVTVEARATRLITNHNVTED